MLLLVVSRLLAPLLTLRAACADVGDDAALSGAARACSARVWAALARVLFEQEHLPQYEAELHRWKGGGEQPAPAPAAAPEAAPAAAARVASARAARPPRRPTTTTTRRAAAAAQRRTARHVLAELRSLGAADVAAVDAASAAGAPAPRQLLLPAAAPLVEALRRRTLRGSWLWATAG